MLFVSFYSGTLEYFLSFKKGGVKRKKIFLDFCMPDHFKIINVKAEILITVYCVQSWRRSRHHLPNSAPNHYINTLPINWEYRLYYYMDYGLDRSLHIKN